MSSPNVNIGVSVYTVDPFRSCDNGPCCAFIQEIHRKVDEEQMAVILSHIGIFTRIVWVELTPPKDHFRSAYVHFDHGDRNAIVSMNEYPLQYWYSIVDRTNTCTPCSVSYWADILMVKKEPEPVPDIKDTSLQTSAWSTIVHRINVLEETVNKLQTMLILQDRLPMTYDPPSSVLRHPYQSLPVFDRPTLRLPIPPRTERQIAQTFHMEHTQNIINDDVSDFMSITTQSSHDSMPPLVPIENNYWEYYQPL